MDGSRAAPGGTSARVLAACRNAGVELVRFRWADHDGIVCEGGHNQSAARAVAGSNARLPGTLGAALDALERDALLSAALDEVRRRAYLAVKRSDIAAFTGVDAAECAAHFTRF